MILFIDFDGVLRRIASDPRDRLNPVLVRNFEATLARFKNVRAVISSSWRLACSLNQLKSHFHREFHARIVGITPEVPFHEAVHERLDEIEKWLHENAYDGPWLALDDQPRLFSPRCRQLLTVDGERGFDAETQARCHARMIAMVRERTGR